MKEALRCCISCILPCGALDVIRIVHVNGRVEEITGTIYAAEILKAHPKHILKKPTSKPISDDFIETTTTQHRPTIVVVPPDAQLQRGKIYFLIPVIDTGKKGNKLLSKTAQQTARRRKKEHQLEKQVGTTCVNNNNNSNCNKINNNHTYDINNGVVMSLNNKDDDKYLSELLSEKVVSNQREKRRGRVAVWRPHLESINETLCDVVCNDHP